MKSIKRRYNKCPVAHKEEAYRNVHFEYQYEAPSHVFVLWHIDRGLGGLDILLKNSPKFSTPLENQRCLEGFPMLRLASSIGMTGDVVRVVRVLDRTDWEGFLSILLPIVLAREVAVAR